MAKEEFRVYGYRWVILGVFMCVVMVNQLLWITFAPITGRAAEFYKVSDLNIGLLSMVFMVVYIAVSIPASWVIDTFGFRVAVGIGAVLTGVSDLYKRRVPFILLALSASCLGMVGKTFATSFPLLLASSFVLGFFLLSAGPVGFQYGAEIAYPAPEGTSNGLLLLMGQISGILFILGMDQFKAPGTGSMTISLVILTGLLFISVLIGTMLRESTLLSGKHDE